MASDEWREVVVEWRGEMGFVGRNPAGGKVQMGTIDGQPGASPMELLLMGVAGCTGMDVASMLTKQRQDLQDLQLQVRGKRAETHPRVYTEIEITYILWGHNLDQVAIERAIQLSEEKYCSASAMLGAVASIRSSYQILPSRLEAIENQN